MGATPDADDWQHFRGYCYTPLVADLVKKAPRLEELYLFAKRYEIDDVFKLKTLTRLRILQVYHLNKTQDLRILAKNPAFMNLTHLLIHPHYHEDHGVDDNDTIEAYVPRAGVVALVHSPHVKSLTHLRLRCSDLGDACCQEIANSGILKRLKVLDLRHGEITDKGAEILAACPDLKNLELLDLERNSLTNNGIRTLQTAKVKLRAAHQHSGDQHEEREYLTEGDFE